MSKWVWGIHKLVGGSGNVNGGGGSGGATDQVISILPGGPTTAQIASPGTLTDSKGNALTVSRASTKYTRKSATFDLPQLFSAPERVGDAASTYWTAANAGASDPVVTLNSAAAPDGTQSASTVVYPAVSGAGNFAIVYQSLAVSALPYTFSIYLRVPSGTGSINITMTPNGVSQQVTACSLTTTWQRFTVTTTTGATTWYFQIGTDLRDAGQSASGAITVQAWGAKLEQASSATAYVSPMLVALGNNVAAVESQGLFIEGPATNLLTYSQDYTNAAWAKTGVISVAPIVTGDVAIAPDGTKTADSLALPNVTIAGSASVVSQGFTGTVAPYTHSVWLRSASGTKTVYIAFVDSQTVPTQYKGTTACVVTDTAWTRFTMTATLTAATWYAQAGVDIRDGGQTGQTALTMYSWGSQTELASVPSSYILTTSAAASRVTDVVTAPLDRTMQDRGRVQATITPAFTGTGANGADFVNFNPGVQQILYEPGGNKVATPLGGSFIQAGVGFVSGTLQSYKLTWLGTSDSLECTTSPGTGATAAFASPGTAGKTTVQIGSSGFPRDPFWIHSVLVARS